MPELPEVETARRTAEQHLLDRAAVCDGHLVLRTTSPPGLRRPLTGPPVPSANRTRTWVRRCTDGRAPR